MRAARLHAPGTICLHREDEPVATPGEEIVRVTAVGLCGSDLHWYREGSIGDATLAAPLVIRPRPDRRGLQGRRGAEWSQGRRGAAAVSSAVPPLRTEPARRASDCHSGPLDVVRSQEGT